MGKNVIERRKSQLYTLAIIVTILGFIMTIGGGALIALGAINLGKEAWALGGVMLGFGVVLFILGMCALVWGIRYIWVASAVKATHGSIAEGNIAKESETENTKKCPKCGATNPEGNKTCGVCGEPLE